MWSGCDIRVSSSGSGDTASLSSAAAAARAHRAASAASADTVVCLSGTFSAAASPFSLGAHDGAASSGGGRVVWRGVGGGATISGGLSVSGWRPATLGGGAVFAAPLPAGWPAGAPVRQLWVDGVRASRTILTDVAAALGGMTPWTGSGGAVGFSTGADLPAAWASAATSIEFTWPIVVANWISPRCTLASAAGRNITLASPCGAHLIARNVYASKLAPPVTAEAVPSFPLPAGSFYHDMSGVLYYAAAAAPAAGAAWVAAAETIAAHADLRGVAFEDLTFQFATWWQPNAADGFVDAQSAVYACTAGAARCGSGGSGEPLAAVTCSNCSDVEFTRCNFANIGAPYALAIANSSQRVNITACAFAELSGGFVKLGSVVDTAAAAGAPGDWDASLVVQDCVAGGMAVEYGGAAGLFAGFIRDSSIIHNNISDAGYSGVSLGWGWGDEVLPGLGGNTVAFNRISRVMTRLRDGGGIYVNGATSAPNVMARNWVDSDEAVYAVFYLGN